MQTFTAVWLQKNQFANPAETAETKGETINFQTDTIEGTAFPLDNGDIIKKAIFKTEAEAIAWCDAHGGQTA